VNKKREEKMLKHRSTFVLCSVQHFLMFKVLPKSGNWMATHFIEMIKEQNMTTVDQRGR